MLGGAGFAFLAAGRAANRSGSNGSSSAAAAAAAEARARAAAAAEAEEGAGSATSSACGTGLSLPNLKGEPLRAYEGRERAVELCVSLRELGRSRERGREEQRASASDHMLWPCTSKDNLVGDGVKGLVVVVVNVTERRERSKGGGGARQVRSRGKG